MSDSGKRQFVAGAVCPACGEIDRTVLYTDGEQRVRECVSCGFREALDDGEPPTEIPADDGADVQVVRFVSGAPLESDSGG